ncbi:MAG: Major Facilitator Superfamily protein [Tenericutes bacterium ADurb.Bin087]|nr:MAG: Major Facilitator Superfamily protein [Tenericutes bacterium ADurb.Bin087]
MDNKVKKRRLRFQNILLLWLVGLAGQLCWNLENQWFNTFVYAEIGPFPQIVNAMVAVSAIATTFATFFFGTLSDRAGKRKPFISIGYIIWGIFTITFGLTGLLTKFTMNIWALATVIVVADTIMSFFGSMGNDAGFNAWTADLIDDDNKGAIGTAIAVQPVIGTIIGTVLGGILIDNFGYIAFFSMMGGFVSLIGVLSLFILKDSPKLEASKRGGFWRQFSEAFNFKYFFSQKELVLVNILGAIYFIGFNVYFVHIGNLFISNYGFSTGDAGVIQGIGLIIAILFTIPGSRLINRGKSPRVALISVLMTIIGLIYLGLIGGFHDAANMFSVNNLPLLLGVIVVGAGYILIMQTLGVWSKVLYPVGSKGQFEGLRIIFFVLIPMVLGSSISQPIIRHFGIETIVDVLEDGTKVMGYIPTEALFYFAAAIMVLALIPLIFLRKAYYKRLRDTRIHEAVTTAQEELGTEELSYSAPTPIFDNKKRHINFGYATDMAFVFDKKLVKKPLRLKEWDFYQIQHGRYVVQLTIGHIAYAQNIAINLIDLEGAQTYSASVVKLFKGAKSMTMPTDPSIDNEVHYTDAKKKVDLHYITKGRIRHLYGSMVNDKGVEFKVDVTLERLKNHDAMVINTPFSDTEHHFYLNYKIGNLRASGSFSMGDIAFKFDPKVDFGLLDWGRGVWPLREVWYWGQVNDYLADGRMINLNLGYGFGNLAAASENMLILDGKAYKLGRLYIENDVTQDYMADWVIKSPDGKINLVMKTIYDRYSDNDFKVIYMKCHQVYGRYYGTITLDDDTIVTLNGEQGFFERSNNKW